MRYIKVKNSYCVRIIFNCYVDADAAMAAINAGGASRFISKRWSDGELKAIVKEAMEKHNLVKRIEYVQGQKRQNE